jgi:hypothetical protein
MSQIPTKPARGSPPSTPSWVKVFGILLIVLVLAVVIMHLTGTNFGGHIRHLP